MLAILYILLIIGAFVLFVYLLVRLVTWADKAGRIEDARRSRFVAWLEKYFIPVTVAGVVASLLCWQAYAPGENIGQKLLDSSQHVGLLYFLYLLWTSPLMERLGALIFWLWIVLWIVPRYVLPIVVAHIYVVWRKCQKAEQEGKLNDLSLWTRPTARKEGS